ncbi:MAG: alpha/beta hydrolase [Fibrobacteres bacterium]|nr:alpha/beta hydrolase [Fibrobacterota bacterium]
MMGIAFKAVRILFIVCIIVFAVGCAFQTRMIFPAEKLPPGATFALGEGGEEVNLRTGDGVTLSAIRYRKFNSPRVILYFHGNAGSLASWRFVMDDLEYLRTDMILVDYRGYGKSGGKISEKGLYLDAEAVYAYARSLGYADGDIIVYGRSIGTGIAVDVARGKPLAGLILESPYASLCGMIYREYWFMLPFLYLDYSLNSCAKMPEIKAPVLILHGTQDGTIPFKYGKALYECHDGPKTLVAIEGGGHNDLDRFPEKRRALEAFLGAGGKGP